MHESAEKNAFSHRITYRDTTVLCLNSSSSTLYGSETWSMTQVVRIRLDTFEQRWLRLSLRVSFPDRCSNADRWFWQVGTHHRKPLELGDSVSLVTLREPSLQQTTHMHCTHLHTYHRRTGSVQLADQGQRGCRLWKNAHPGRKYWSVYCLPASPRPLYVEAIREDSRASCRGTLVMTTLICSFFLLIYCCNS